MKFKILHFTALALLVAGNAQGQYFQRMYGTPGQDLLESGITIGSFPQGYAMAGYTGGTTTAGNNLMVTRTDLAGTILGAPSFNNAYTLFSSAGQVSARGRRIVELPLASTLGQFAVFGDHNPVTSNAPTNFFYMVLNGNGTIALMPRSYSFAFTGATAVEATSMTVSAANPSLVYVCGNATFATGTLPVVMCLQANTGNIVWAWVYRPLCVTSVRWTATDLVESPYPTPANTPEVFVVGRYDASGGNGDGCIFSVNGGNGSVLSGLVLYGTNAADEGFNAINIASNTIGSGAGFVVAGYVQDPIGPAATRDSWAMKVDATATVVDWSSVLRYGNTANADDVANDIIERLNTFNQYEYYVGGFTSAGVFGNSDAVVYKLNAGGFVVGGGQLTYGGQGLERALQLGQYNNAATNGLSVFGTTQSSFPGLGATDFYNVKAYFNGVTACNFSRTTIPTLAGPGLQTKADIDISQPLSVSNMQAQASPVSNALICTAPSVFGGSNARLAEEEEEPSLAPTGLKLYPNPVSADQAFVTVAFEEAVAAGDAEIEVWNALGQLQLREKVSLAEGATTVEVKLGSRLAPGIYHFMIRYGDKVQDFQVTVQ